jgi:hypothetical protein
MIRAQSRTDLDCNGHFQLASFIAESIVVVTSYKLHDFHANSAVLIGC